MQSRRRRASRQAPALSARLLGRLAAHHLLLAGLLAALLLALVADMPWLLPAPARIVLLQIAATGLLCLLALHGPWPDDINTAACRGVSPFLFALLVWCAVCAAMAPYRNHASVELLRVILCAGVYFGAAYGLRPEQLRVAAGSVIATGAAVGVYSFFQFGSEASRGAGLIVGAFGSHENLGSFLVLLLPVALALALDRSTEEKTRLALQAATIVLGSALLLARTRSAWVGAAAALVTLLLLYARYMPPRRSARGGRRVLVTPVVVPVVAFFLLIALGGIAPLASQRASTLARLRDDSSFADRLHRWRSAARMASERPLTGWGLGMWPVLQGRWTHQGDDVPEVLSRGAGHANLAHNFWVQWAAETGGPGLGLYVAAIAAFLFSSLRALPTIPSEYRKTLLAGCLATVVGACVDAVGAPSYHFPGISALFWIWMGIGVAACRETRPKTPVTRPAAAFGAASGAGLAAALLVLGIGCRIRADGRFAPRGTLRVMAEPSGSAPAGSRVRWTAVYRDPSGRLRPTSPGVFWAVTEGCLDHARPIIVYPFDDPARSGQEGTLPVDVPRVTVGATYWDDYSRRYDASATVIVGRRGSPD